ncbi:MAG TPA: F0F1 ATP synthase subunit A, partial [Blastocatellia bacterium]|nr:F0F1 ATP synthase subunit A [Blastocatellia bacterium]
MFLLNLLQEHGQPAAEHGAAAAEHAAEAGKHSAHHIPWLVEKLNHSAIGEAVFNLQSALMPKIYGALKIFGPHWPGEGKTFQQYLAEGNLPIPTQVVMFGIVVFIAVVVLWVLRGKLSTESPTSRQQTFEVGVETVRGFLNDLVGSGAMRHFPVVMTFAVLILLSNLLGMLPDMISPTANFNVTLALALS